MISSAFKMLIVKLLERGWCGITVSLALSQLIPNGAATTGCICRVIAWWGLRWAQPGSASPLVIISWQLGSGASFCQLVIQFILRRFQSAFSEEFLRFVWMHADHQAWSPAQGDMWRWPYICPHLVFSALTFHTEMHTVACCDSWGLGAMWVMHETWT